MWKLTVALLLENTKVYYLRDAQIGGACCFFGPQCRSCFMLPCLAFIILRWLLDVWKMSLTLHYLSIYSILLLVSIPTRLISIKFILILSFHIHLCLPNGFFPSGLSTEIFVKFTSVPYVLNITVLFVCVISCWCSLKTITHVTKLLIIQLSSSSRHFPFLSNIVASTLLSDTFIFRRKCSFHGDCMLWRRLDRRAAWLWNSYSTFHPRLTLPYDYWPGHCLWNFKHEFHIHMADRPGHFTTTSLCAPNINFGKEMWLLW